jgi:hypothetical protein
VKAAISVCAIGKHPAAEDTVYRARRILLYGDEGGADIGQDGRPKPVREKHKA